MIVVALATADDSVTADGKFHIMPYPYPNEDPAPPSDPVQATAPKGEVPERQFHILPYYREAVAF